MVFGGGNDSHFACLGQAQGNRAILDRDILKGSIHAEALIIVSATPD
jgi:hypothetical protein